MSILDVQDVFKAFGERRILGRDDSGVSFAVDARDRIGIVGVNGTGKSTLLRMLAGSVAPDAGKVVRRRDLTAVLVEQEPRLEPGRTVIETLRAGQAAHAQALARLVAVEEEIGALAPSDAAKDQTPLDRLLLEQERLHDAIDRLGGFDLDHEVRTVAAALELPPDDAKVDVLSPGERRRIALGRALLGRSDLLLLDEPTNHLDARTVEWLETRLAAWPGALVLVTHDRYFLDRVATRIVELDRGRLHTYEGNYSRFLELQAERLGNEDRREQERLSFLRREIDWIRRGPSARRTKQQARIDRFDAATEARPERRAGEVRLILPPGPRLGKTVLELDGVSKALGGKRLLERFSLKVVPGERIGVVGPNGAGKSTLVRMLLGRLPPDAGTITVGQNTQFSFLDQTRADLRDDRTVLEEVAGGNDHVFLGEESVHVRTFLRMFLFDAGFADAPVGTLSGGERNRVQLAKLLRQGGNFLLLDEPTNDLDLVTLGVLEEALTEFPGCALVVSHDRWFLDRVATSILAFEGDGRVVKYEGNYSDWLARRRQAHAERAAVEKEARAQSKAAAPSTTSAPASASPKRKLGFNEKRELEQIESRIEQAETRVSELEAALEDPDTYKQRAADVPELVARLEKARQEVEAAYRRWEELEELARLAKN